jgi:DNA-binding NarL/FixJ family response regulator
LLIDDHIVVRTGLRHLVEGWSEYEVVGEAGCRDDALRLAAQLVPDLALVDVTLSDCSGIDLVEELRARVPHLKMIMLTVHEDPVLAREAFARGASGYVIKRGMEAELQDALAAAARGDLYVHPAMTRSLIETPTTPVSVGNEEVLTARELEVLRLIVRGYTSRQIAEELVLSVRTVDTHRGNMMQKLALHRRADLIQYALQRGLFAEVDATSTADMVGPPDRLTS